jgi:hypothetical protein
MNAPTIMPMISSNGMAHMGFLQEGSPSFHYIPIRKPLKWLIPSPLAAGL